MRGVLLATIDYPPQRGGVARYIDSIKQTIGDCCDVLYWKDGAPSYFKMIKIFYESKKEYHCIWINHLLPLGTAALFSGVNYVIFLHGKDFDLARRNLWKKFLTKRILLNADKIVTNSHALAKEVRLFVGSKKVKPITVHPCVRGDFIKVAQGNVIKHENKNRIKITTIARLVERKGHVRVIKAIADMPNVEYQIIGDGPYRSVIEREIERYKIKDRVKIRTDITDQQLPKIYKESDIFVMPTIKTKTDREGFGIVYLEASLFGIPVIASNQPGVDEAILDRITGILVRDDNSLKIAIRRLSSDSKLRERMGQAGHDFVVSGFTREKQFSKLVRLCGNHKFQ